MSMITTGLYGFRKNGKDKLMLNPAYSDPDNLGGRIIDIVKIVSIEELNEFYDNIIMVNLDDLPSKNIQMFYKKYGICGIVNNTDTIENWRCVLHKTQGRPDILYNVWKDSGQKVHMVDDSKLILNSFYCRSAYIINLDNESVEFYLGLQKETQKENRYQPIYINGVPTCMYPPCKFVDVYSFMEIAFTEKKDIIDYMWETTKKEGLS